MKPLITMIFIMGLLHLKAHAQSSAQLKIHFLNITPIYQAKLRLSADPKKSVVLKPHTWLTVQPTGDSLDLVIDDQPYKLHFELGKQYYYVVQTNNLAGYFITEQSEREFMLMAVVNSVKGPQVYVPGKETD